MISASFLLNKVLTWTAIVIVLCPLYIWGMYPDTALGLFLSRKNPFLFFVYVGAIFLFYSWLISKATPMENKIRKKTELPSHSMTSGNFIIKKMRPVKRLVSGVIAGLFALMYFIAGKIIDDSDPFLIRMHIEFANNHPILFPLYCITVLVVFVELGMWLITRRINQPGSD